MVLKAKTVCDKARALKTQLSQLTLRFRFTTSNLCIML